MTASLTDKIGQSDPAPRDIDELEFKRRIDGILTLAPDDGVGVVAFTNGARGALGWLGAEVSGLLGDVLAVPEEAIRTEVLHHPELWSDLCGWYAFRGSFRDVQRWFVLGAEVVVRRGQLMLRALSPIPAATVSTVARRRRNPHQGVST